MSVSSKRGRKPFNRKVSTITKDLKQTNIIDAIEEMTSEEVVLDKGVLNTNWVMKKYNVTKEEAIRLVLKANGK